MRPKQSETNPTQMGTAPNQGTIKGNPTSIARYLSALAAIITLLAFLPRDARAAVLVIDVSGIDSVGDFADPEERRHGSSTSRQEPISPALFMTSSCRLSARAG